MHAIVRNGLGRIIERGGLIAWPRLLVNLRCSRRVELLAEHGIVNAARWLGCTRHHRRFGAVSPERKTKAYPCELRRREEQRAARQRRGHKRKHSDRYDTAAYRRAVGYGIEKCNKARLAGAKAIGTDADQVELVPDWHPHPLRHNAATNLRREHGIEVARLIPGHRSAAITEVYAEVDHARAVEVMGRIG